jgi:Ca2+-binding EF-hand superfamily protein
MYPCVYRYDVNNDKFLDLMEMKLMMEKLQAPQTHVGLKNMIAEIDEDNDGQVSYREVRRFDHENYGLRHFYP